MTKINKLIILLITSLIALITLIGCSGNYKLTYYADGKIYHQETISKNQTIKLPNDPIKEGYLFKGWVYKDEPSKQFSKNSKVRKNTDLQALFQAIIVERFIDGTSIGQQELLKIDEGLPNKENLVLDKWYVDSNYTTKYTNQQTDKLYARYVALVSYDNGHEIVFEQMIPVNTEITKPTMENIIRHYMANEDISFTNDKGEDFDFSKPVESNTKINVNWHSPYLKYAKIASTGDYQIKDFDSEKDFWQTTNHEVLRFPSFYNERDNDGKIIKTHKVTHIDGGYFTGRAKKVIIDEGIKTITGFQSFKTFSYEEIKLPKSLRIIENSFNGFENIAKINIPHGVEQIINSFWAYPYAGLDDNRYLEYEGLINLPSSVKSLSGVPTNINIEGNTNLIREEKDGQKYLYYLESDNTKTLISTTTLKNKVLVIPEGVDNIKVGAIHYNPAVSFIKLPDSFKKVKYNLLLSDYPYYIGHALLDSSSNPYGSNTGIDGYAVINQLEKYSRVIFNSKVYPQIDNNALCGTIDSENKDYTEFGDKVVFTKIVPNGEDIKVKINTYNKSINKVNEFIPGQLEETYKSGQILNIEQIINDTNLNNPKKTVIKYYNQFGEPFDITKPLNSNTYLDIYYEYVAQGYLYEIVGDEAHITGFNENPELKNKTGLYTVVIPEYIEGKKVTLIRSDSFMNNNKIEEVIIANSVKKIGENAFKNTNNLKNVVFAKGDLEYISRSAFENSGVKEITITLQNVKHIEPYAFKTKSLEQFKIAAGEELSSFGVIDYLNEKPFFPTTNKIGRYFLGTNTSDDIFWQILKYTGTDTINIKKQIENETPTEKLNVHDFQLVAVAGGAAKVLDNVELFIGRSARVTSIIEYLGETLKKDLKYNVARFEVLEGSVYYLGNANHKHGKISLGVVKKVHKNAFTDIEMINQDAQNNNVLVGNVSKDQFGNYYTAGIYRYIRTIDDGKYEELLFKEQLLDKGIFEDGWFNGLSSEETTNLAKGISDNSVYIF